MAPWRYSSLCSFCCLLAFSCLYSSYSGLSVGSSSLHRGQEFVFPSQGRMQAEWKRCSQGSCRTVSSSSNSSRHTGHFRPASACFPVTVTFGRFSTTFLAAGGGSLWSQSVTSRSPRSISIPLRRLLASSNKAFWRYCSSGTVGSQLCSSK